MKKGLLIVFEGIDGSGKTTQVGLLADYLKSKGVLFEVISFPRYENNLYGKLIRRYLEGEFGSIQQVNPNLAALAYAGDRDLAKDLITGWLSEDKVVIANRYVSSSKAHLGANLSEENRREFIEWIEQLEYQTNKIPKENLTILLKVEPKIGQNNSLDELKDVHEQNLAHLETAGKIYLDLAKEEPNWYILDCMIGNQMKSRTKIHKELLQILDGKLNVK